MEARQSKRATFWLQLAQDSARTRRKGSGTIALVVFALVAFATLPFGLIILLSNQALGASADEAKVIQFAGYALLGLGILMTLLAYYQWRVRAGRKSLRRSAVESPGTITDCMGVAQWLGRYWHGSYPPASLMNHAGIFRFMMQFPEASVLIDLTPREFMTQGNSSGASVGTQTDFWWANILVAVDSPLPEGTIIPNHHSLQWIEDQGYQVKCEAGCLRASGAERLQETFRKNPSSIPETFKVAAELAQIAATMRVAANPHS